MKKLVAIALGLVLLIGLIAGGTVYATTDDQIPSANAAFASNDVFGATVGKAQSTTDWFDVLNTQIKTGEPKDLVVDVSAETMLVTSAKLSGDVGSQSVAGIDIRVLVDGQVAIPGPITFDNRLLKITGDLTHHYTSDIDGDGEAEVTPLPIDDHWIEIYMSTKSAHSFNFAIENVGSGVHDIVVQAQLSVDKDLTTNTVDAAIGHVSMTVDEVMFKYASR